MKKETFVFRRKRHSDDQQIIKAGNNPTIVYRRHFLLIYAERSPF